LQQTETQKVTANQSQIASSAAKQYKTTTPINSNGNNNKESRATATAANEFRYLNAYNHFICNAIYKMHLSTATTIL